MVIEIAVIVTLLASGLGLSTPLLFAALGEKISERAGVLNLGVEGMMIMGAFAGFIGAFISGNIVIGFLFGTGSLAVGSWLERLPVQAGIWHWHRPKGGTTCIYQHSWL